ncbi:hypothetical protein Q7P36_011319 [Cladosporium allicinum]
MDQRQSPHPEASKPQILDSSQDPEEPDTAPAEPLITQVPIHSRDVEESNPTTPAEISASPPSNDPNDLKEEPNPPEPTLRTFIKQTLQNPPPQPHPSAPASPLAGSPPNPPSANHLPHQSHRPPLQHPHTWQRFLRERSTLRPPDQLHAAAD